MIWGYEPDLQPIDVSARCRTQVGDVHKRKCDFSLVSINGRRFEPRLVLGSSEMGQSQVGAVEVIDAAHERDAILREVLNYWQIRFRSCTIVRPFCRSPPARRSRQKFLPSYRPDHGASRMRHFPWFPRIIVLWAQAKRRGTTITPAAVFVSQVFSFGRVMNQLSSTFRFINLRRK